jgi:zinc transport system substrate-binding protein
MKKLALIIIGLLIAVTAGCGNDTSKENNDGKLEVFTTIYPLSYFTERIGGDHVKVVSIIPPGADAHTFEPSTKTMVKMTESDAFIYLESETDEFSSTVASTLSEEKVPVIDAASEIAFHHIEEKEDEHEGEEPHEEGHEEENSQEEGHEEEESHDNEEHPEHGTVDPHIWLDPILAGQMAENIYKGLVKLKPEAKDAFKQNLDSLHEDLQELDVAFKEKVQSAPKKSFIVSHAAYGYWAERYELEQIAISGLSPSHEPSQQQIETIIENAKKEKINYILFEENVNNKVAAMIKKEVGADTMSLHNLETLTKDDIENNRDYLAIMKQNIDTLSKALQ